MKKLLSFILLFLLIFAVELKLNKEESEIHSKLIDKDDNTKKYQYKNKTGNLAKEINNNEEIETDFKEKINYIEPKKYIFLNFNYGKDEKAPPIQFAYTCSIGVILSLPNIILNIVRKCKTKMTASCFTIFMNLLLHLGYGNLIGVLIKLGGEDSYKIGLGLIGLYGFICFVSLIRQLCYEGRGYFDVIYNLCKKLDDSKTLHEILSLNRKYPPKVIVGAYASHQESREVWIENEKYEEPVYKKETVVFGDGQFYTRDVFSHNETKYRYKTTHYSEWGRVDRGGGRFHGIPGSKSSKYEKKNLEYKTVQTWKKELDYEYVSWEDVTQDLSGIRYCSIIKASFLSYIYLDEGSKKIIERMKSELYNEGLKHDTDVHTYDEKTVPEMIHYHVCSLNDAEYIRIKKKFSTCLGYLIWFIFFILGYSACFEAYARYEIGEESITIYKTVSSTDDKRAKYNTYDNPNSLVVSYKYTRVQTKKIENKIKEGKMENKDLENPLVVIN